MSGNAADSVVGSAGAVGVAQAGARRAVAAILTLVVVGFVAALGCSDDGSDASITCPAGAALCANGAGAQTCCGGATPVCCASGPSCVADATQCPISPLGTGGASAVDCQNIGPSQTLAAQCCPSYGVDACGPGLVCAALDARTISSCYLESSRMSGEGCTDDALCASGACNLESGVCRSLAGEDCQTTADCAAPLTGSGTAVCAAWITYTGNPEIGVIDTTESVCAVPETLGDECGYCVASGDCPTGYICSSGRCVGASGTVFGLFQSICCVTGATCEDDGYGNDYCTCR